MFNDMRNKLEDFAYSLRQKYLQLAYLRSTRTALMGIPTTIEGRSCDAEPNIIPIVCKTGVTPTYAEKRAAVIADMMQQGSDLVASLWAVHEQLGLGDSPEAEALLRQMGIDKSGKIKIAKIFQPTFVKTA